jgi:hypothetical protein
MSVIERSPQNFLIVIVSSLVFSEWVDRSHKGEIDAGPSSAPQKLGLSEGGHQPLCGSWQHQLEFKTYPLLCGELRPCGVKNGSNISRPLILFDLGVKNAMDACMVVHFGSMGQGQSPFPAWAWQCLCARTIPRSGPTFRAATNVALKA